jgi:hypothetical protein
MIKLTIQKTLQKTKQKNPPGTKSCLFVKVLELFLGCPILVLAYNQEL